MALVAFLRGANGGGHRRFRPGVLASPSDVVRFVSIRSRSGPVRASLAVVFPQTRSAANLSHCEVHPVGVDVSTSIVINRPRAIVSDYAANPSNVPDWYVNIKTVEWKTPPPVTIGSQIAFVAHFLGRRMAYTYEVIDLVPGERLVMRTAEGPFPMETSYRWETISDGATRMTLRNRGNPSGFSKWLAPFMAGAMRRANRKDLLALKQRLESSGID